MQQLIQHLRDRLSGKQLPSLRSLKDSDDWFDTLFALTVQEAGFNIEELTEEQREKLEDAYEEATTNVAKTLSEKLIHEWRSQSKREMRREAKQRKEFERLLSGIWDQPISRLETLRSICFSIGSDFNESYRPEASANGDFVFEALTRLHAHACMVVDEIVVLLKHGFAHGAHSRWRTLHEIVVTCYFILEHGNEVAEKYLLYDHIESYHSAKEYQEKYGQYQDFFDAGGHEPIEDNLLKQLEAIYVDLCKRFGDDYGKPYGWAAKALNSRHPTFKQVENAVGLSNMRPFYRFASQHLHADPKGVLRTLGQSPSDTEKPTHERVAVAGPSVFGLADPGQGAAIALFEITGALLSWKAGVGETIYVLALESLRSEVVDAFISVHDNVEASEQELADHSQAK